MSCSITGHIQPSLEQFYKAMEEELFDGLNVHMIKTPDLSYLANQGVLLFNTSLTCEMNKPGSHNKLWEPFMKYLFEEVIITTGMPVVFLGKEATKVERYLSPFTWVIKVSHPASASYNNTNWDSEGMFTNVNKILKDNNNEFINWIKTE
jgi:uracil DNA glycosylase